MNNGIKLSLMLGIGGPMALIGGLCLGYGCGKLVCGVCNKIGDYCYYKRRG